MSEEKTETPASPVTDKGPTIERPTIEIEQPTIEIERPASRPDMVRERPLQGDIGKTITDDAPVDETLPPPPAKSDGDS